MRVFAISDLHIDFKENEQWMLSLSVEDYQDDILIVAGDIVDDHHRLGRSFNELKKRFKHVLFVPGNHDLWVRRNSVSDSLQAFLKIVNIASDCGILMCPFQSKAFVVVPLYSWYDFSFGQLTDELRKIWMDFEYCKWPSNFDDIFITNYFIKKNEEVITKYDAPVISFSHFLPRIDLMPSYIPSKRRVIYPVLGTTLLDEQIRRLDSVMHIYGHSHVNTYKKKQGVVYINNAFGYPSEGHIAQKDLLQVL